jgi:Family of unknown function (DUF6529)
MIPEAGPVAAARSQAAPRRLLLAALLGAAIAVALGVYANAHNPSTEVSVTLGFTNTITMKVWLATVALFFACVQLLSALWMYGRLPLGAAPSWLGSVHRISGRLAFLVTLPVAYACLYQLGFQHTSFRVLAHSVLGCVFYGAFAAKVLIVRSRGLPGYALPLAGGLVFVVLVYVWLFSALWYIGHSGFPPL